MSFGFLNAFMLLGLAALALPVLAHLLSKRKFDVVSWGAMQFLELGRRTRRRIRLEEILLLLLRMGLLAAVVFALARPWAQGSVFSRWTNASGRDVVFIIDGSYSMGWEGKAVSPHAAAVEWVHDYLEELHGGDTVALLDARDQVRPIIEIPTGDFARVREQLAALPPPSGTSRLGAAAIKGVQILSRTTNVAREVIILTDGQALPWSIEDASLWARLDDQRQQPGVPPRLWVVNVGGEDVRSRTNYSLDTLELSRELTVPDFPIRIKTSLRQSGGSAGRRQVHFEIDGQRLDDKTVTVNVPQDGAATVEFEHRFAAVGSYIVSAVLDGDDLPGDNRSDAAVIVSSAIPVLLVDGAPHLDPVKQETFFAQAALSASGNTAPWVKSTVIEASAFDPASLAGVEVVILANVAAPTEEQASALQEFVARGGGLVIAPGDRSVPAEYERLLGEGGQGLLPAALTTIETDAGYELGSINIQSDSLELPWLRRFRRENDVDFLDARYEKWWKLTPYPPASGAAATTPSRTDKEPSIPSHSQVAAQFDNRDPALVTRTYGEGMAVLLASPIDTDWNTLPSKNDFVPFLHELVFLLASQTAGRNVDAGMPLLLDLPPRVPPSRYEFLRPDGERAPAEPTGNPHQPRIRCADTSLPGVYRAVRKDQPVETAEKFVVNFDRSESDLTQITDDNRRAIEGDGRAAFIETVQQLLEANVGDGARTEMWRLLMLLVLGLLVFEVVMTRRLVRGGHESIDDLPEEAAAA